MTHSEVVDYIAKRLPDEVYFAVTNECDRYGGGRQSWSHSLYIEEHGGHNPGYLMHRHETHDHWNFADVREVFDKWVLDISCVKHNTPLSTVPVTGCEVEIGAKS